MADQPVMLITGASSGIGAETARAAAKQGYRLVLAARSEDKLKGLQQELGGEEKVLTVQCDVQSGDDQKNMVDQALAMVPNILPAAMTLGFMGIVGIRLDVASVLIAAIAIGISVNDTSHLMFRFQRELRAAPGDATSARHP